MLRENNARFTQFDEDPDKIINSEFKISAGERINKVKGRIQNELVEKLKETFGGAQ